MATNIVAFARPLSQIVTDLATTAQRLAALDAKLIGAEPSFDEEALFASLDDRRIALEREADAAFYAATGVAWDLYERVRA